MHWTTALHRNHAILLRLLAGLFVMAGIEAGGSVQTMPRYKRIAILRLLRPVASAYRRVIVIAAFVYELKAPPVAERRAGDKKKAKSKTKASATSDSGSSRNSGTRKPPPFPLIDPRKNFEARKTPKYARGPGPWITFFGPGAAVPDRSALYAHQEKLRKEREGLDENEDVSASALSDRLNSLKAAMDDLPGQAMRLVKLRARMARRYKEQGKPDLPPMRPGNPPGFRRRNTSHEVYEVLVECHRLALRTENEVYDST